MKRDRSQTADRGHGGAVALLLAAWALAVVAVHYASQVLQYLPLLQGGR